MSETSNELVVTDTTPMNSTGLNAELSNLNNGQVAVFSTVKGTDHKSKVGILNALTNSEPLADNLNKPFKLANVVIQSVDMPDERTGEINAVPRITLIDEAGKSLHVMSSVVYKDLKNIFGILGMPHKWPEPLPVIAEKAKAKTGSFITLRLQ